MNTKLTLSVDSAVVVQAKKYAHKKNKSVSKLVEDYLKNIISQKGEPVNLKSINSPMTDSLVGMFKDNGMDYKKLIEEARTERKI